MALMFGAKIKTKIQTSKYSCTYLCTYLCTRHKKKFAIFTLTLHPLHPLKGGVFLSFPLLFPFRFPGKPTR